MSEAGNIMKAVYLAGLLAVLSLSDIAAAQTAASSVKADVPPPRIEKLEEGPSVKPEKNPSLGKPDNKKINEKRNNAGKVTEVEVKTGNTSYTLKADPEVGNAPAGTMQGQANRPAQWKVLEFGGKTERPAESRDVTPPAPVNKPVSASQSQSK